jgi:hypothetical protein
MVAGLVPSSKKAYATALMDTLDFLCDGFIAPPLGATATKSSALLARRIAMMKDRAGVARLTLGRLVLVMLVAAIPMSLAVAAKSQGDEKLKNKLLAGLRSHLEHIQSGVVNFEVRNEKAVIENRFVAFDNKAGTLRSDVDDGKHPVKVIRKGAELMRFVATGKGEKLPGYGGGLARYKVGDSISMSLTGMPVDVRGIGYCAYQWLATGPVDGVLRGLEKGELVSASLDKDSGIAVVDFRMFEHPQLHTVTWIDTRNDYVPVRDEVQVVLPGRPPRVDQRVEASWDRINKTVVPVKSTSKIFGRGGDPDNVREVRLTWKTVNEPVPEKLFSQEDLKLPNGTYIVDARSGKPILEQVTGQKPPSVPPLSPAPKDHSH